MKRLFLFLFSLALVTVSLQAQDLIAACKNGKWGCLDYYGNVVIPFIYDDAKLPSDNLLKVKIKKKWGYINTKGKTVIPCKYDTISSFYDGTAIAKQADKWEIMNKMGQNEIMPLFDSIIIGYSGYYSGLILGRLKGKYCAYYKNKIILPAEYDSLRVNYYNYIIVGKGDRYGLADTLGNIVIPIEYHSVDICYSNFYRLETASGTVFRNIKTGETLSLSQYYYRDPYPNGYKVVSLDDCDIYENRDGVNVFGKRFHTARPFSEGIAVVTDFDLTRYCIDTLGNIISQVPKGFDVYPFDKDGLALSEQWDRDGRSYTVRRGIINKKSETVIAARYKWIYRKDDFFEAHKDDGLIEFYDIKGNLISPEYSEVKDLTGGDRRPVKRADKWGYVDTTYREVIEAVYDDYTRFSEDVAGVCLNGKWGYIDKSGNRVIPFIFDEAEPYNNDGLAVVKYKDKYGVIDMKCRYRIKFEYDHIKMKQVPLEISDLKQHMRIPKGDRIY
jgi:hypothetical protein